MKHNRIFLVLALLVLASIACQAALGGAEEAPTAAPAMENTDPEVSPPTPADTNDTNSDAATTGDFPMTPDAYNIIEANGTVIFYTKLSLEETMDFYRTEYTSMGYTERELLTVVADGTFSFVFDGDPSGQAVVIQSVDLGDGSRTVTIRLEAL
jgi:hypothetical protein